MSYFSSISVSVGFLPMHFNLFCNTSMMRHSRITNKAPIPIAMKNGASNVPELSDSAVKVDRKLFTTM